ncbi:MAG TPA: histidinol dehydrogenase [Methanomassiliicoccales archaeon]|jgi:histidinol dehydrogenase
MWQALEQGQWMEKRKAGLEDVRPAVTGIIEEVSRNGDRALIAYTEKFDRIKLDRVSVDKDEIKAAYAKVDENLVEMVRRAAANIRRFHELQKPNDMWLKEVEPGVILGVKTTPLDRIGAYVPGGRASYPSTALMCAIPAKVAGVRSIIACTPAPVNPLTLVAMDIAGVDEIYQIGGAQAIAAMAIGTESIAPVQKIVGPGNVYVTAAKMLLRDKAEMDFPAGPSEVAIIADDSADPRFVAADVMAQAEHDPNAACILVTVSERLAQSVGKEIDMMLPKAERKSIIERSLGNAGYVVTDSMERAVAIINEIAPEHLSIQVRDQMGVLSAIRNAGSIFIGPYTAVACGDYASGTNHVLPTAGYAKLYSGLNVAMFCKTSTVQIIDRNGLESLGDVVEGLATAEGLHAHARSVRIRRE